MNKEELIKELEQCENRAKEIRGILSKDTSDIDTWFKFAEKEDHRWVIDEDNAPLLRKLMDKQYIERYKTIDLDDILNWIGEAEEDDEIDEETKNGIYKELMTNNIGSMVYDW